MSAVWIQRYPPQKWASIMPLLHRLYNMPAQASNHQGVDHLMSRPLHKNNQYGAFNQLTQREKDSLTQCYKRILKIKSRKNMYIQVVDRLKIALDEIEQAIDL